MTLVDVLAAPFSIQLPAEGLGKTVGDDPSAWVLDIYVGDQDEVPGFGLSPNWLFSLSGE